MNEKKENEKQILIVRKDGKSYYRAKKKVNYDKLVAIKWSEESIEKFKKIAKKKNTKYQKLMKEVLEEYIEGEINE